MVQINSFTFYYDYYNLIDTLPSKDKQILLVAITDYMFKDLEPTSLKGHNQAIFNTLKNQLDLSKNNSKRRSKKSKTKEELEENREETEEEPKKNKTSVFSFNNINNTFKGDYKGEKEIIDLFQDKGIIYSNTPEEFNIVNRLIDVDKELISESIDDAKIKNVWTFNYVYGIIKNKLREIKKEKPNFEMPKWFDKKIEKQTEGLEELNDILKDF